MTLAFDHSSSIWPPESKGKFFSDLSIDHRQQVGGSCVSTGLSLLSKESPTVIREQINTQDPVSWSRYLQGYGMKLAYCATDLRRLLHYQDQLLAFDDLFTISTYCPTDIKAIGAAPDSGGWVCGSHFVVLHRHTVYDTLYAKPVALNDYEDLTCYVKRLFRVVPLNHERGL